MRYFQILLTEGYSYSLYKIQYSLVSTPSIFVTATIYNTANLSENLTTTQLAISPGVTIQIPDDAGFIKVINQDGIGSDITYEILS